MLESSSENQPNRAERSESEFNSLPSALETELSRQRITTSPSASSLNQSPKTSWNDETSPTHGSTTGGQPPPTKANNTSTSLNNSSSSLCLDGILPSNDEGMNKEGKGTIGGETTWNSNQQLVAEQQRPGAGYVSGNQVSQTPPTKLGQGPKHSSMTMIFANNNNTTTEDMVHFGHSSLPKIGAIHVTGDDPSKTKEQRNRTTNRTIANLDERIAQRQHGIRPGAVHVRGGDRSPLKKRDEKSASNSSNNKHPSATNDPSKPKDSTNKRLGHMLGQKHTSMIMVVGDSSSTDSSHMSRIGHSSMSGIGAIHVTRDDAAKAKEQRNRAANEVNAIANLDERIAQRQRGIRPGAMHVTGGERSPLKNSDEKSGSQQQQSSSPSPPPKGTTEPPKKQNETKPKIPLHKLPKFSSMNLIFGDSQAQSADNSNMSHIGHMSMSVVGTDIVRAKNAISNLDERIAQRQHGIRPGAMHVTGGDGRDDKNGGKRPFVGAQQVSSEDAAKVKAHKDQVIMNEFIAMANMDLRIAEREQRTSGNRTPPRDHNDNPGARQSPKPGIQTSPGEDATKAKQERDRIIKEESSNLGQRSGERQLPGITHVRPNTLSKKGSEYLDQRLAKKLGSVSSGVGAEQQSTNEDRAKIKELRNRTMVEEILELGVLDNRIAQKQMQNSVSTGVGAAQVVGKDRGSTKAQRDTTSIDELIALHNLEDRITRKADEGNVGLKIVDEESYSDINNEASNAQMETGMINAEIRLASGSEHSSAANRYNPPPYDRATSDGNDETFHTEGSDEGPEARGFRLSRFLGVSQISTSMQKLGIYRKVSRRENLNAPVRDSDIMRPSELVLDDDDERSIFPKFDMRTPCVGLIILAFLAAGISTSVVFSLRDRDSSVPARTPIAREDFELVLAEITDLALFTDETSPQSKALDWIATEDPQQLTPTSSNLLQRYALMVLYFATDGIRWGFEFVDWHDGSPECEWDFITCEGQDVIQIEIENQFASGSLPPEIGALTNLKALWMARNSLTGTLPESMFGMTSLVSLNLAFNSIKSDLSERLGDLVELRYIELEQNEFVGTIPSSIVNLVNLVSLSLSFNRFNGPALETLIKLTRLEVMDLRVNEFDGTIPVDIDAFSTLKKLGMRNNNFVGTIPSSVGSLAQLTSLDLSFNKLTGTLPPEFLNLRQLEVMDLSKNKLNGTIPTEFSGLVELQHFLLDNNEFSGNIPSELSRIRKLKDLFLSENNFSGTIPTYLGRLIDLEQLVLWSNELSGTIPSELTNLTLLRDLFLQRNRLVGPEPEGFCRLKTNFSLGNYVADCVGTQCKCCDHCNS